MSTLPVTHRKPVMKRIGERRELKSLHREWFVFYDEGHEFGVLEEGWVSCQSDYNLLRATAYRTLLRRVKETGGFLGQDHKTN